jgi:methylated-DNA-[protein]-cysteine S-methyltransferase
MDFCRLDSPIGPLTLVGNGDALVQIRFVEEGHPAPVAPEWRESRGALDEACRQLAEYFDGQRTQFNLALSPQGTAFQRAVWKALLDVGFGETASYSVVAQRIGRPAAVRAVGAANGRNPLPIVIPCHRIIGADGALTGFGGGLPTKAWLLRHEAKAAGRQAPRQAGLFD